MFLYTLWYLKYLLNMPCLLLSLTNLEKRFYVRQEVNNFSWKNCTAYEKVNNNQQNALFPYGKIEGLRKWSIKLVFFTSFALIKTCP